MPIPILKNIWIILSIKSIYFKNISKEIGIYIKKELKMPFIQ